ncbi:MAG TPA: ABC transporter ATP-binding protein [Patescibacteria group bacterium]|nr:ABC transporter ATP-binding protein [Patescibacteria group bacterium]
MQSQTWQTLKIYFRHARRYPLAFFLVAIGLLGNSAANVYIPFLYKRFFDLLASHAATVEGLVAVLIQVLIYNSLNWAAIRTYSFAAAQSEARVMSDLLNTAFDYLQYHSYRFFTDNFAGSLARKVNRYAKAFEEVTDQLAENVIPTVLRVGTILVVLLYLHPLVGGIILVWAVIFLGFNYFITVYKLKFDLQRAQLDTNITGRMADTVSNNINLKLFSSEPYEIGEYHGLTEQLYQLRRKGWFIGNFSDAGQGLLMVALEFAVMFAAVQYWHKGQVTVGDFVLIQAYIIQMFQQLWNFGRFFRRIYESLADANEMTEILLQPHEIQDAPAAPALRVAEGGVEFRHMDFSYQDGQAVFEDFNLHIAPKEKVALIGPSGGGKSTVTKLLLRFYDIQGGEILIDGQNIARATQHSLRREIALVPQDPVLFHRSLMDNIRYGRPEAGDNEVMAAAKLAHADEFIDRLPQGYQTFVGERGIKLSGGQRQRVAIARAILKNAPLLILDEATSSLDSESERYIQDALKTLMRNKTVMVIAHRLSTIMQMDRIIVLEDGKITEQGKHQELLKIENGTYQRLWEIQAGGFAG